MCDLNGPFRLCTCSDGIDKSKPHWVLERMNSNLKDLELVHIGMFPPEYHFKIEIILSELNNNSPFDFEYHPKQKDVLTLNFEYDNYNLIYTNGEWRDFYEYFVVSEEDLNFKNEGRIKLLDG